MTRSSWVSAALAFLSVSLVAGQEAAGQTADADRGHALQSACFAPGTLAAKAGEEKALKGDRRFSVPPSRTQVHPFEPLPTALRGSIRRVTLPPGLKLIALTLDLCEDIAEVAGYDAAIFDTLRREKVKATLFAGGKWMRSHETRALQLITDPLFEIANHAEAHRNLRLLKDGVLQDEILGPQRAYENLRKGLSAMQCAAPHKEALQSIPPRLSLFRFPYGACDAQAMEAVNDAGLAAIQWDVSTGDPSPQTSAAAIVRTVMARVKPGSIIIAHANGRGWHTAEALPRLIEGLRKQGYVFVTVSELLAAGTPEIAPSCYDGRPGDTDRYDTFAGLGRRIAPAPRGWTASVAPEPAAEKTARAKPARKTKIEPPRGAQHDNPFSPVF